LSFVDSFSVSEGTGFLHPPHWTDFQALGGWGETKSCAHSAPTSAINHEGWMDGWMDDKVVRRQYSVGFQFPS